MNPSTLNLLDMAGNKITILAESIKSIQAYFGVTPLDIGGMSIAGPASEYVLIKTSTGSHEIPRRAENDSELHGTTLSRNPLLPLEKRRG